MAYAAYAKWYAHPTKLKKIGGIDLSTVLVIDTETTGLDPGTDEILQLSICDGNGKPVYNQKFKPKRIKSWHEAEAVNHITPESVSTSPRLDSVHRREIASIIDGSSLVVAYNWGFDGSFLANVGIVPGSDVFDVMIEYAPVAGVWNDYYGDFKWQKLAQCADHYGYGWSAADMHDAMADARATAHCFRSMAADGSDYRETVSLIARDGNQAACRLYAGGSRVSDELELPKADVPDGDVVFCWIQDSPEGLVGNGTASAIEKAIEERGGRRYKTKAKGAKWFVYTDPTATSSWLQDQIGRAHENGKKVCYLPDLLDFLGIEAKTVRSKWGTEFRKSRKYLNAYRCSSSSPDKVEEPDPVPSPDIDDRMETAKGCGCLAIIAVVMVIILIVLL